MLKCKPGLRPALLLLALTSCVPPQTSAPTTTLQGAPPGTPSSFATLPGWTQDNTAAALASFVLSCQTIAHMPPDQPLGGSGMAQSAGGQAGLWQPSCTAAAAVPPGDDAAARNFFTQNFTVYAVPRPALITGYFEPEYPGAKNLGRGYAVPLYDKPADPALAALPRAAIDNNALYRKAPVTAYLTNPVDAFMLQIYGAGRVQLPNGKTLRVNFDGQNGQPYTPIGKILLDAGDLAPGEVSFQSISAWLSAHPGEARKLMEENENYVYLMPVGSLPDDEGAPGALGVPKTAGRTLAIDTSFIPLGTPVFLSTTDPISQTPIDRLAIAQDTDAGIHGADAAKLFFGASPDAEATAGVMRQPGQLYILLPNPSAGTSSQ